MFYEPAPGPVRKASREAADRLLETHLQTRQKLEVLLRYWEVWGFIVAQARAFSFCVRSLWMVDGFAGNGLHRSNAMPGGFAAGTPVQAFRAGVQIRRRYADVQPHVRAVELNRRRAQELERRLVRAPGAAHERPDWRVMQQDFAAALPMIIDEMALDRAHGHSAGPTYRDHAHRSLWFVDPDGIEPISHAVLEPLERLPGAEVIINLDMSGMWRVSKAALAALEAGDPDVVRRREIMGWNERRLNLTWGSDQWRHDIEKADPRDVLKSIAQGYADTFAGFEHRNAYPLRGSRAQKRYLIHLTHSERARERFEGVWRTSFTLGTLSAGENLETWERAARAKSFHQRFAGATTTLEELFELGLGASKQQIASVCRSAEDGGLGDFDATAGTMKWRLEPVPDPTLGLFEEDEGR